ncbi:MAG: helix-turn-helix transcriptional regulator [Bacteroidetes bacterium]|nr:helix-turn-helix transcriptional regulator [Bacteroidota bacterium]
MHLYYVRNMVCNRCIMVVKQLFTSNGIEPLKVTLGEVHLAKEASPAQFEKISAQLVEHGFSVIDDKKAQLISRIKAEIIKWIQESNFQTIPLKFSAHIEQQLKKDYNYLSNLFSEVEGQKIEQYMILQRVEKVKEFLAYDELSFNDIAEKTGFSSSAHLSAQFKKVTGLTPSHFKKIKENKRKPIDEL